ncbi:nucleoside-triphosphatase, partial [Acidobacteriota bacterium]
MIQILTGPVHSGKTALLKEAIPILQKHRTLTGYLSLSIWEGEKHLGYDMYDIQDGTHQPFIRRTGEEEWERIGLFYFLPKALESARN